MTLNEYITQSEPQANVKVILKEGEYIQRNAIKVTPFSVQTTVDIPVVTQRYGIKDNYIRIGTARQLFARHPQTGELRGSVFPARRCPGTARTFSIHAIPKGGYGILRTMGKREPATGGFAGT